MLQTNLERKIVERYYDIYIALLKQRLMTRVNLDLIFNGIPLQILVPFITPIFNELPFIFGEKSKILTNLKKVLFENQNVDQSQHILEKFTTSIIVNRELFIDLVLGVTNGKGIKSRDYFTSGLIAEDFFVKNPNLIDLISEKEQNYEYLESKLGEALKTNTLIKKFSHNLETERFLLSQELIMQFTFLDAYLSDLFEIICNKKPEIVNERTDFKIKEPIRDKNQNIVDKIIFKAVKDFGFKGVKRKIDIFQQLNFVDLSNEEMKLVEKARITRNLIVHNGSRINEEYLDFVNDQTLRIDDLVPIDSNFIEEIFELLKKITIMIMEYILLEFFNIIIQKDIKIS